MAEEEGKTLDDELIDTDSDDSDYEASEESIVSSDGSLDDEEDDENVQHGDEEAEDSDDDDSDYEDEDDDNNDNDSHSSESGSNSSGDSGSGGSGTESEDSGDVQIGGLEAPFTGYIFPAVHKLVASGNVGSLLTYLEEMYNPLQPGPQIWEISDGLGRNAIHLAVLSNNLSMVKLLMDYDLRLLNDKFLSSNNESPSPVGGSVEEKYKFSSFRRKFDDMSVIHLALSNGPWDDLKSIEMMDLLLSHPGSSLFSFTDYWKRTPLHIAVMAGKLSLVKYCVEKFPTDQLFAMDEFALIPLHYAIDTKHASILEYLLSELCREGSNKETFGAFLESTIHSSASPDTNDLQPITRAVAKCSWECLVIVCRYIPGFPQRAIDIASEMGIEINGLSDVAQNLVAAQKCVFDRSRETAIVYDKDCLRHIELPSEFEDGHFRLKRIKAIVENPTRLEVLVGDRGALRMGEFQNVKMVNAVNVCPLSDILRVHEWAYIKRIMETVEVVGRNVMGSSSMIRLDKGDTNVTAGSWLAARKAAGSIVHAMDLVCAESSKNAFVAVRPPGHHVSARGAVDPNLEDDDTGSNGFCLLNNVAIGAAYALSVHRHVISKVAIIDLDIHHGNGTEAIVRGLRQPKTIHIPINTVGLSGNLNIHTYHPWLDLETDASNVFFASIHRFDGRFYPQSGQTGIDGNIVNAGLGSFSTSADFRNALNQLIFPQLVQFNPDLILVSAGFDGHVRDRLASGEWDICENDYYWATEQLVAIANMCCKGRLVSVLEGGYNTKGGWLSPLAQSVANHVRALSSSWASKWEQPPVIEEPEEQEDDHPMATTSPEKPNVGIATNELLARADALIDDHSDPDSLPKRQRTEETDQEFTNLFGADPLQ